MDDLFRKPNLVSLKNKDSLSKWYWRISDKHGANSEAVELNPRVVLLQPEEQAEPDPESLDSPADPDWEPDVELDELLQ